MNQKQEDMKIQKKKKHDLNEKKRIFKKNGKNDWTSGDPYYNKNISRENGNFEVGNKHERNSNDW